MVNVAALLLFPVFASAAPFTAVRLRVNALASPLTVDTPRPRFSWALSHPARAQAQSSYRLVVSTAPIGGAPSVAWDSGVVNSSAHISVPFGGAQGLASDADFTWTLTWFNASGAASLPATATFSTALPAASDWRNATWVGGGGGDAFRATFALPAGAVVARARLYYAGLGTARAAINGAAVDDHQLGQYANALSLATRFLYDVADVAPLLRGGCNVLAVQLFGGWWARKAFPWAPAGGAQLRALLSVTLASGEALFFGSGTQALPFVSTGGPVTGADIYGGETFDARVAGALAGWDASCAFAPGAGWAPAGPAGDYGAVMSARHVAVRTDEALAGAVANPAPGVWVFDFSQNHAMQDTLHPPAGCAAGTVITLSHGELLYPADGGPLAGLVHNTFEGVPMQARYICSGNETGAETYESVFVSYGGRFVQVDGWPSSQRPIVPLTQYYSADRQSHYLSAGCQGCPTGAYAPVRVEGYAFPAACPPTTPACVELVTYFNKATGANLVVPAGWGPIPPGFAPWGGNVAYALAGNYSGPLNTSALELWVGHAGGVGAPADYFSLASAASRAEAVAKNYTLAAQLGRLLADAAHWGGSAGEGPAASSLTSRFIHSDLPKTGAFTSSNPLLNALQRATRYSILSNIMDVPTDCPHRERRGWLGDAQHVVETAVINFDGEAFYEKYLRDITDTQQRMHDVQWHTNGAVPDCVPLVWPCHAEGDPGWAFALWAIAEALGSHYAPPPEVEAGWLAALAWGADYWVGIVQANKGVFPYAFYGDWSQFWPNLDVRPPDYGNYYYARALGITADFAARVGSPAQAANYSKLYAQAKADYVALFYNASTGCFAADCNYVSSIFALDLRLLPEGSAEEARLLARVMAYLNGSATGPYPLHFGGGITTTKLLYTVLERFGAGELGLQLQLQPTPPSLASFLTAGGGTTLFEQYNLSATNTGNGASFLHAMFGGSGGWYFTGLAGLSRPAGARGWGGRLALAPPVSYTLPGTSGLLTSASASMNTSAGLVASSWALGAGGGGGALYLYNCSVPVGATASLALPTVLPPGGVRVAESGAFVWAAGEFIPGVPGVLAAAPGAGPLLQLELASGFFLFSVTAL